MRHLVVKALRLRAWLQGLVVEHTGAWMPYATTDDPSKLHELREQELNLLAELIAISAEYSETRDFNSALAELHPADLITGRR